MYWNGDERASASRLGWDMVLGECNTMRCGMNYITDSKIWISKIRVPARLSHQVTLRLMEVEGYSLHYTFLLLSSLRASGELYTAISLVHRERGG
jgi:hypothetical protein